jgi:hypothetical protein
MFHSNDTGFVMFLESFSAVLITMYSTYNKVTFSQFQKKKYRMAQKKVNQNLPTIILIKVFLG